MTATAPTELRRPTMPAEVLAAARERRRTADAAEADLLQLAVEWAVMHPVESIDGGEATLPGTEGDLAVAGEGAPLVAEFCVAEFAAAIGLSPDAGAHYLGEAVELRYRLPRVYARVVAGDLVAWRARKIAARTLMLSWDAARFIDRSVAHVAHKIGPISLDRLVTEAIAQFMPEEMERQVEAELESRHVTFHDQDRTRVDGTMELTAALDLPDALDLQAAVTAGAAQRKALGSTDTLDVRRSQSLGDLARQQPVLEFEQDRRQQPDLDTARRSSEVETPRVPARQVILYVHLSDRAIAGKDPVARVEQGNRVVSVDQVRSWCGRSDTAKVILKPVLDLEACDEVNADVVPNRHAELIAVRDRTCVFPWCTRPARAPHPDRHGCDADHIHPRARGGPTCPCNLAQSRHIHGGAPGLAASVAGDSALLLLTSTTRTSPSRHHGSRGAATMRAMWASAVASATDVKGARRDKCSRPLAGSELPKRGHQSPSHRPRPN